MSKDLASCQLPLLSPVKATDSSENRIALRCSYILKMNPAANTVPTKTEFRLKSVL